MRISELDDIDKEVLLGKVIERARADLNDGRPLTEMATEKKTDADLNSEIADSLSDAIRATDEAYNTALDAWGINDSRTMAINAAWAEVETAFRLFHE